jgi:hypothetical protein
VRLTCFAPKPGAAAAPPEHLEQLFRGGLWCLYCGQRHCTELTGRRTHLVLHYKYIVSLLPHAARRIGRTPHSLVIIFASGVTGCW